VRHLDMPITAQKVWQALHASDHGPLECRSRFVSG